MDIFSFWQPILMFAVINAILALGLYVNVMSGQLLMAQAAFMGIGAYVAALLTTEAGWGFWPATLAAIIAGAIVGALVSIMTLRMSELAASLATLGFGETMVVLAYNTKAVGGAMGLSGVTLQTTLPLAFGALIVSGYLVYRFERSRIGLAARAVRENPVASAANGINIPFIKIVCMAFGGALAGLAGSLSVHYTLVATPDQMNFAHSLNILIFVLFGGSYTMWGAILGAAILTALPEALRFSEGYRFVLYGLLITGTILWRPQGLLGGSRGGGVSLTNLFGRKAAAGKSAP